MASEIPLFVNKLLETQGITLREVKKLNLENRKKIADDIEATQGEQFEHDINGK